jgi:hypothetical protein
MSNTKSYLMAFLNFAWIYFLVSSFLLAAFFGGVYVHKSVLGVYNLEQKTLELQEKVEKLEQKVAFSVAVRLFPDRITKESD